MSQNHETEPTSDETTENAPLEETPAVAGGQDDTAPEQGEGAHDSY